MLGSFVQQREIHQVMSLETGRGKNKGIGHSMNLLLCALVLAYAEAELRAETTFYVGKHFEVRDHDAPVKYVFNGNTRVARVTGSLSTNERIQRLRLRAGWNLVCPRWI
jgi:hypothetical protein